MAIACPVDLDIVKLGEEIRAIYSRVATDPASAFHFHRGPDYAAAMLGYDASALAELPPEATASFAGLPEAELLEVLAAVGFRSSSITDRFDPFRATSK